jgi:AcrR family transcriptional regulator
VAYRRTPNVEAKLARTRRALLSAARHQISLVGLRDLNVTDVARDAGVSVGTMYRHFPAKHELLAEIVDDICGHEREIVAKVAADGDDPAARLVASVRCFADRAVASGRVAYAVIAEPAPAEIEAERLAHRRALADIFAGIIADGVERGRFPLQDPAISSTAIVGAVSEVVVGPLAPARRHGVDVDVDAVLAETVAFVLRAVVGVVGDDATPPPTEEDHR